MKMFQYHKFYLFDHYFKQYNYVFYLDCGIHIFQPISQLLQTKQPNTLLAHSDAYPQFEWKLKCQFDETQTKLFSELSSTYNLSQDYCQTTIMLYDTSIIDADTFQNLYDLAVKFPISKTNDQGIIALYYTQIKPHFKQIPVRNQETWFYDYLSRAKQFKYIMLKIVGS